MNILMPNKEIWRILDDIISSSCWFSGNKKVSEIGEDGFSKLIELMDDYYTQSFNLPPKIDDLVQEIPGVDFSYRYKTAASLKRKLYQIGGDILLYQAVTDILGLRFVFKTDNDNLMAAVEQFLSFSPLGEQAYEIKKQTIGKHQDSGKIVIHVNNNNNFAVPIELEFCTRTHALLNEYLQEDINKITDIELVNYALELRDWLESVSQAPEEDGVKIQSYVDYVYEKKFFIDEDEPQEKKLEHLLHSKLSHFKHLRFGKQSRTFIYSEKDQTIMFEAPDPKAGKDTYIKMKKYFPAENIGMICAKDIQTLLRTHRELKLSRITRNMNTFLNTVSEVKEKIYAY